MHYALFLLTALSLAGCVSQRAVLVNDRGEEMTCETTASGIFPSLVIANKQQECISEAQRRGYRVNEDKSKAEQK